MAFMEDMAVIRDYLKKIQRVVSLEADFNFFGTKLIKKEKIDDLLCCVYAKLPDKFKKYLKDGKIKKYNSVVTFSLLHNALTKPFKFNKNFYAIDPNHIKSTIAPLLTSIERDIRMMESDI